ncbi:hypothetical protein LG302_11495 [Halomonas organivorans]
MSLGSNLYEKIQFRRHTGYWANLTEPSTFNEKLCRRKLDRSLDDAPMLQDKCAVREFVTARVGDKYLTECYQMLKSSKELDWDNLPLAFVVKGNDGCGTASLMIVDDKQTVRQSVIKERIDTILKRRIHRLKNFYYYTNEWWYGQIEPKVLIEEHLHANKKGVPLDYKFFVFHGRVEYIQVDFDRFIDHRRALYDRNWKRQEFRLGYPPGPDASSPMCLDEMIEVAEELACGYDFLRVDLYEIDQKRVVFGEITVAPSLGHARFDPIVWDKRFGDLW